MSALEIANNLQQKQIDTMQTTIDAQAETIAEQAATIEILQSTDVETIQLLDAVESDVQGILRVLYFFRLFYNRAFGSLPIQRTF